MGIITGIVKLVSNPIEGITVRLYYRDTGELYGETTSSVDGTFTFSGIPDGTLFTAIALSQDPAFNHGIDDGLFYTAPTCDNYQNFVSIHLPMTGIDNGTSFPDRSIYNTTFSRTTTVTKTNNYKYSGSSGYFNGSSYLSSTKSYLLNLTNKDFTIESWIYISSNLTTSYHVILSNRDGFSSDHNITFLVNGLDSGGKLMFQWGGTNGNSGATLLEDSTVFPVATWVHVAVTRSGNTLRLFKNGQIVDSVSFSSTFFRASHNIEIGRINSGYYLYGYLQDLRVTLNHARYTSNFNVPEDMHVYTQCECDPLFSNNVVLYLKGNGTDGSTTITDSSPNNLSATTVVAGITVSTDSNSFESSAIKTLLNNNSIYFSRSNFVDTNEDFTIELWYQIISQNSIGDGYIDGRGSFLRLLNGGPTGTKIVELAGMITYGTDYNTVCVPSASVTYLGPGSGYLRKHFVLTRKNNLSYYWFNGIMSVAGSGSSSSIDTIIIGSNPNSAGRYTSVFIDELRLTKGYAKYTESFTPPTSAYLSITCS